MSNTIYIVYFLPDKDRQKVKIVCKNVKIITFPVKKERRLEKNIFSTTIYHTLLSI